MEYSNEGTPKPGSAYDDTGFVHRPNPPVIHTKLLV